MIFTRLYAGLGNQLFQFAAGTALARKHNDEARFEHSVATRIRIHRLSMQSSPLVALGLKIPEASTADALRIDLPWRRVQRWIGKRPTRLIQRGARSATKIAAFNQARGDIYLHGYWQGPPFFQHGRDQIARQLLALTPNMAPNRQWLDLLAQPGSAAVHVRRGDYLKFGNTPPRFRILQPDYYQRAIKAVQSQQPVERVVVFSDDISWCREHLNLGIPCHFVERLSSKSSMIDDFMCLASAQIIITGNSTFSWWAAWISHERSNATVVCPQEWFHDPNFAERNRLLQVDSWINLPSN